MNARIVILAFLAARAPAAYTEAAILQRVNASGLMDSPVPSIALELASLASDRMGGLVNCDIDRLSKTAVWYATDAGINRWQRDGRPHVE